MVAVAEGSEAKLERVRELTIHEELHVGRQPTKSLIGSARRDGIRKRGGVCVSRKLSCRCYPNVLDGIIGCRVYSNSVWSQDQ